MNYRCKLYMYLLLFMIGSCICHAKKKVVVVVDSIQIEINNSKKANDIEALINQCLSYPKYAEQIREHLLFKTNYDNVSNDRLGQFVQKAESDSILTHGFEALIIERHQKGEEISEVINDVKNYRIYHNLLTNYLLYNINYQRFTYDQLCTFKEGVFSDAILNNGFTYKITCMKDSVISLLNNQQIQDIFSYYDDHKTEQSFLTSLLKESIIDHIATYDYKKIRTMNKLAEGTAFGDELSIIYEKERAKQKSAIKSSLQNLKKSDDTAINYWESYVGSIVDSYFASHLGDIIRECGKQKFSKDKKEIDDLFNEILNKYIDFDEIKQTVYTNLSLLEECLNESHESFIYQIAGKDANESTPYVQISDVRSRKNVSTKFDLTALYAISNIQHESDDTGTALGVGGFLLGLVSGGLGLLASAASAYHSYNKGKSAAEREGAQLRLFADRLVKDLNSSKKSIIEDIKKEIVSRNNSNFRKIEQIVYERY